MLLSSLYRYSIFLCAFIFAVGSCTSTIALQQAASSTSLPTSTSFSSTTSNDVPTATSTAFAQSSPLVPTTLLTSSTTTSSSTLTSTSSLAITPSAKATQSVGRSSLSKGAEVGIIVAVTLFCVSAIVAAVVVHSMKPPPATHDTHILESSTRPAATRDYSLSSTERAREQGDDRQMAGGRWEDLAWAAHSPYWF